MSGITFIKALLIDASCDGPVALGEYAYCARSKTLSQFCGEALNAFITDNCVFPNPLDMLDAPNNIDRLLYRFGHFDEGDAPL